jgi:HD-GYP domain-containing protein (c-di-GMP phosphodiesterase class II)
MPQNFPPEQRPLRSSGADDRAPQIRAAELIGALSLATDLGVGEPLEHGLRTTVIAVRLAGALGLEENIRQAVYYVSLLRYAGCTAESNLDAALFGDEIAVRSVMLPAMFGSRAELFVTIARKIHAGEPLRWRAAAIARALFQLKGAFRKSSAGHCEVTQALAKRLGLPPEIQAALGDLFERWDGKGFPDGRRAEDIPLPVRIMQVAEDADLQFGFGGLTRAVEVIGARAGTAFDPVIADAFCRRASDLLVGLDAPSIWDEAVAAEPGAPAMLEGPLLDEGLRVLADFADLKSPFTLGHSPAVAELAGAAGHHAGLGPADCIALRRAGLVHDLGRVAITASIWNKAGLLSHDEEEKVRLHPYFTERVLQRPDFLRLVGKIACRHQERLDGSGYHRGARATELSMCDRILAAASAYEAMIEPRPHRPARSREEAAVLLRDEARAGRLDAAAVSAVLEAAGHEAGAVAGSLPAGISPREADVLRLLARGLLTKQIANRLGISPKTADRHIQHIYEKIGVSTRAGATLFAMQHGLLAS